MKFVLFVCAAYLFFSCGSSSESSQHKLDFIYVEAIEIGDWDVARMVTFEQLANDSNNLSYFDTLANIYFLSKDYEQALICSKKAIPYSNNVRTIRIAFDCCKSLKQYEELVDFGEMLSSENGLDVPRKYQLGWTYANQRKYDQAEVLLKELALESEAGTLMYNEFSGNDIQSVPYNACAYNLLGFIRDAQGRTEEATVLFNNALQIFPEYRLAKENLELSQSYIDSTTSR